MSIKPVKNRVFCVDAERAKMLFDTQNKADNFIKFNAEEIKDETGYAPKRSYYCMFCNGFHVTSSIKSFGLSKKERLLLNGIEKRREEKNGKRPLEEIDMAQKIESKIERMTKEEKDSFFSANIEKLKIKITKTSNEIRLKHLRKWLQTLYIIRKKHGYVNDNNKLYGEMIQDELEDWKQWAEQKINQSNAN